jgi:hypothetical protein
MLRTSSMCLSAVSVEALPTPEVLVSAGKRKWEKFLHTQQLAPPQTYQRRMDSLHVPPNLSLAKRSLVLRVAWP